MAWFFTVYLFALRLGVPERDIVVLEARADITWDEAVAVRDFLEEQGKDSLILVTSRYRSARAKKTFEKMLGNDYKVRPPLWIYYGKRDRPKII